LIESNINVIKPNLKYARTPIIVCFFLTVLLGVITKYLSYLIMRYYKDLENGYLFGVYSDLEMTPIDVDEEIATADYDLIIKKLKEDFDETISYR
jgi:hypothetical protein